MIPSQISESLRGELLSPWANLIPFLPLSQLVEHEESPLRKKRKKRKVVRYYFHPPRNSFFSGPIHYHCCLRSDLSFLFIRTYILTFKEPFNAVGLAVQRPLNFKSIPQKENQSFHIFAYEDILFIVTSHALSRSHAFCRYVCMYLGPFDKSVGHT